MISVHGGLFCRTQNVCMCGLQFIHPPAAGGGTPEVMAFLNGIIVHGSLSLKNLVVKFTANVFAVSSGLPAAIQAPIITYGSVLSAVDILLDISRTRSAGGDVSQCIISHCTVEHISAWMQLPVNVMW